MTNYKKARLTLILRPCTDSKRCGAKIGLNTSSGFVKYKLRFQFGKSAPILRIEAHGLASETMILQNDNVQTMLSNALEGLVAGMRGLFVPMGDLSKQPIIDGSATDMERSIVGLVATSAKCPSAARGITGARSGGSPCKAKTASPNRSCDRKRFSCLANT